MDTALERHRRLRVTLMGVIAMRMSMKHGSKLLGIATPWRFPAGAISPALALNPGDTVDNFRLLDHTGASRELYYLSDMKAVVLMAQGNGCDVVRKSVPELQALRDKYRAQGVELMMINSNLSDSRDAIEKEAKAQGIDLPILLDETQIIGESLGLKRNGELLVVEHQGLEGCVSRSAGGSAAHPTRPTRSTPSSAQLP